MASLNNRRNSITGQLICGNRYSRMTYICYVCCVLNMKVTKWAEQFCAATDGGANFQTVHTDLDPSLVESFLALAPHWLENSLRFGKCRLQSWNRVEQTHIFQWKKSGQLVKILPRMECRKTAHNINSALYIINHIQIHSITDNWKSFTNLRLRKLDR